MNRALLGKWLWRIGEPAEGMWNQMLKYGVERGGWDISSADYKSSALWRGITSVKDNFGWHKKYRVD